MMKRLLAALALVCLLPVSACAERTVLRLLGLEESAEDRRVHPDIAYQQVRHDVWGDPLTWIAENGADVVYINGWGEDLRSILARAELLDLRESAELSGEIGRMTRWVQELVTAEDGVTKATYAVVEGEVFEGVKDAVATYIESNAYAATNIIDNNLSTRWSAYNRGVPQAICIDLGEEQTVVGLGTYWFGDGRESTYNIYVTNEPTVVNGWFTEPEGYSKKGLKSTGSGANGGSGDKETFDLMYQKGRYVTIYTTANSNNVVSLWEADIYTASANDGITVELEGAAIIGIYEADGTFIEAIRTDETIEIPYSDKIGYIKVFTWQEGTMIPLKEAEIIEIK